MAEVKLETLVLQEAITDSEDTVEFEVLEWAKRLEVKIVITEDGEKAVIFLSLADAGRLGKWLVTATAVGGSASSVGQ